MRLLLDEHFPRVVAEQLRARGHDAQAVTENPELRGLADALLLETAFREQLVIVTEDVSDFRHVAAVRRESGQTHAGLIFTTHNAFPRGNPRTVGRLVTALDRFLADPPGGDSWERWLS